MTITDQEFDRIRKLVYSKFGINLTDQKRGLVTGRLQKVLRQRGFSSFAEYISFIENDPTQDAISELINKISTNHTFFYREKDHFEFFVDTILPEIHTQLKTSKSNDIRLWCAGCSSGEEPYTIIMLMMEYFGREYANLNAGILATDISEHALNAAMTGVYPENKIDELPQKLRSKYFQKASGGNWGVVDQVKREVTFRRFNLMNKQFPFKKQFDIILCRNVMIYFDRPTRVALVNRFYKLTQPKGYLFIGHSETLGREECPFTYVKPALYRKLS